LTVAFHHEYGSSSLLFACASTTSPATGANVAGSNSGAALRTFSSSTHSSAFHALG
jgi:hypothetical protein